MPGFMVQKSGTKGGKPTPSRPVYSYSWEIGGIGDDSFDNVYLRDCTLPNFTAVQEKYTAAHLTYKFAKSVEFDDVKVTFYDTAGIKDRLEDLRKAVWTPEGGIAPADNYQKDTSIIVFIANGKEKEATWTLHNSWLSGLAWAPLTYTASEAHFVTANITYDWATVA